MRGNLRPLMSSPGFDTMPQLATPDSWFLSPVPIAPNRSFSLLIAPFRSFSLQRVLIVTYIRGVGSCCRLLIFLFPPFWGDAVDNASSLWRRHWAGNARHFWLIPIIGSIALLCSYDSARAQLAPLTKVDQERLDQTFLRGAIWLRDSQGPEGTWAPQTESNKVGYAA